MDLAQGRLEDAVEGLRSSHWELKEAEVPATDANHHILCNSLEAEVDVEVG